MTPNQIALILHRLDEHGEKLDRIEGHVTATNSRVAKLELWQARVLGGLAAVYWIPSLAAVVVAAVIGALLT